MIELFKYKDNSVFVLYWKIQKKTKKYGYDVTQTIGGMAYGKDATQLYKTAAEELIKSVNRYREQKKWTITKKHPKWWVRVCLRDVYYHKKILTWIEDNANCLEEIAQPANRKNKY